MSNETHSEHAKWHGFVEGFHISGLCRYCGEPRFSSRHVMPAETHSEKGLRELVAGWRKAAQYDHRRTFRRATYDICADELEQALAATPAVREPGPTGFQEGLEKAARQVENYYMSGKGEQLRTLATMIRNLSSSSAGEAARRYDLTVRPWAASGGSTVHDETFSCEAKDARQAILALYAANEYNWAIWRVVDVQPAPAATEKGEGK